MELRISCENLHSHLREIFHHLKVIETLHSFLDHLRSKKALAAMRFLQSRLKLLDDVVNP